MSDLHQNHMRTSHTVRAYAQEVWDKSDSQSGRKVVTHDSKSDLPLEKCYSQLVFLEKKGRDQKQKKDDWSIKSCL